MPLSLDEIRDLRDKLEPLSYGIGGIQVKLPFKTDEMCLTAYPSTSDRLSEMQRILEPYQKHFIRIDLPLTPDESLCWQFLDRIDFRKLRSALIPALRAEIEALCNRESAEPLYAFVLGVSPAHHGLEIFWNTFSDWEQRVADYESSGSKAHLSTKYNGPDFDGTTLSHAHPAWKEVWAILQQQENISSEFFNLTGGGGLFFHIYESRFRSTAAQALREVRADFDRLPRTSDFVAYVQDYVGGGDPLFLALETVPEDALMVVMPWLFPSLHND